MFSIFILPPTSFITLNLSLSPLVMKLNIKHLPTSEYRRSDSTLLTQAMLLKISI